MAQKKGTKKKADSKPARVRFEDEYEDDDDEQFTANVKGIIAVLLTFMIVMIALMFTARSMFVLEGNEVETILGRVTSTVPTVYEGADTTTAAEEEDNSAKKKRTASPNAKDGDDEAKTSKLEGTTKYRCISAVYLHPQPSADSENLLVIPLGAVVDVQKDENDWLYLDYNGTIGWAYGPGFFTANE